MSLVAPPPDHCVGPQSEAAGKADSCAGCPNQKVCATGAARQPDPAVGEITERLGGVRRKVLVLSGKGGVGKSTFATQLAFALAGSADDDAADPVQVGLLDVDICGPSVPRLCGLEGHTLHNTNQGWEPCFVQDNLAVVSVGFMLASADDAVIWRGPKKNTLIKQFLRDVCWGDVDCLVVDTPPGTSDEHLSLVTFLKESGVDGAVVITTPQTVALNDVRKELNFCKKVQLPVLGVVENMAGFVCPGCKNTSQIFPPAAGGGARAMAEELGVEFLGSVPLDPLLTRACEDGKPYVSNFPHSPAAQALQLIFARVAQKLNLPLLSTTLASSTAAVPV